MPLFSFDARPLGMIQDDDALDQYLSLNSVGTASLYYFNHHLNVNYTFKRPFLEKQKPHGFGQPNWLQWNLDLTELPRDRGNAFLKSRVR